MVLKDKEDIGGEKMHERLLWAGEWVKDFCDKHGKKLTDFEFTQIAAKLAETAFVRSEMTRG